MRILQSLRSGLLWAGALLGGLCIILFVFGLLFGVRAQVVVSGSMEPDLPVGSLLLVRSTPVSDLVIGDVVTVVRPSGPGLVTHRVVGIEETEEGATALRLKGDANEGSDPEPYVVAEVGKKLFAVPGLGTAATFLQTPFGLGAVVLILAMVVLTFWLVPAPKPEEPERAAQPGEPDGAHDPNPASGPPGGHGQWPGAYPGQFPAHFSGQVPGQFPGPVAWPFPGQVPPGVPPQVPGGTPGFLGGYAYPVYIPVPMAGVAPPGGEPGSAVPAHAPEPARADAPTPDAASEPPAERAEPPAEPGQEPAPDREPAPDHEPGPVSGPALGPAEVLPLDGEEGRRRARRPAGQ